MTTMDIKFEKLLLSQPEKNNPFPLAKALSLRKSSRSFSDKALPMTIVSNLLWSACGINRKDKRRTAPSAVNWQEIDIYVSLKEGLFLYNIDQHSLDPLINKDIREHTGRQPFTSIAPLNLIFVADFTKIGIASAPGDFYAATDSAFISQNVYLYAAATNLATVVIGNLDKESLKKTMNLRDQQKIILTQSVGFFKS
jgi:SagB-type dehydrogenase family enzyme